MSTPEFKAALARYDLLRKTLGDESLNSCCNSFNCLPTVEQSKGVWRCFSGSKTGRFRV